MRDADRLGAPYGAQSGAQSGALSGLPEDPEARIRALLARNAELASALRHRSLAGSRAARCQADNAGFAGRFAWH